MVSDDSAENPRSVRGAPPEGARGGDDAAPRLLAGLGVDDGAHRLVVAALEGERLSAGALGEALARKLPKAVAHEAVGVGEVGDAHALDRKRDAARVHRGAA